MQIWRKTGIVPWNGNAFLNYLTLATMAPSAGQKRPDLYCQHTNGVESWGRAWLLVTPGAQFLLHACSCCVSLASDGVCEEQEPLRLLSLELQTRRVSRLRVGGSWGEPTPKTTGQRLRNNSGGLVECSLREINRGEEPGEVGKEGKHRGRMCTWELPPCVRAQRTEALLCLQPRGADKTPGQEERRRAGVAGRQRLGSSSS